MTETMTKTQILVAMEEGRLAFDRLLNRFDPQDMSEAVLENGWTVANVVGHIVLWYQLLLSWLTTAALGENPILPAPGYTWDDIDRLNEDGLKAQEGLPINSLLAEYRASLTMIYRHLEQFDDETLNSPYFESETLPLWKFFAANTCDHYAEHAPDIAAWLKANR